MPSGAASIALCSSPVASSTEVNVVAQLGRQTLIAPTDATPHAGSGGSPDTGRVPAPSSSGHGYEYDRPDPDRRRTGCRDPTSRDRAVDFLRAFSIAVVVLWHWVFSITHWNDHGAMSMPNPIGHVPALWVLT